MHHHSYSANQEVNTHGSTIGSSANAYLEKRGGGMHGDYAQGATGAVTHHPTIRNHAPPPERGHQQQYQENKGPSSLHEISQHAQSVEGGNNVESNVETAGDKSEDSDETDESESESESEGEYELGENDESGDEATESKDEESAAVQLPQYPTRQSTESDDTGVAALDPGVKNVYTWLRGGVLNGEADLDQRWWTGLWSMNLWG
ncbi:hypothetical protein BASA81_017897 [Batrachochytrium salamandrivorans]|nr:hypothetical protein BASA81_017897 [Batrachochytrium salamandrivorans]